MRLKNWVDRAAQAMAVAIIAIPYLAYLAWRELRHPEPL